MKMAESSPNGWKTVGKGEIALYEQFLLFPKCFKKKTRKTRKNQGLFGKGLMPLVDQTFEDIVGRRGGC